MGNKDWLTHWLKRLQFGLAIWEPHNFKNLAFRLSWPIALFAIRLLVHLWKNLMETTMKSNTLPDVILFLIYSTLLSDEWRWFETLSRLLWRHCNVLPWNILISSIKWVTVLFERREWRKVYRMTIDYTKIAHHTVFQERFPCGAQDMESGCPSARLKIQIGTSPIQIWRFSERSERKISVADHLYRMTFVL